MEARRFRVQLRTLKVTQLCGRALLAATAPANTISPIGISLVGQSPNVDATELDRRGSVCVRRVWNTHQHVVGQQFIHVVQTGIAEANKIVFDVLGNECETNAAKFVVGEFRVTEADLRTIIVTDQLAERQLNATSVANEMALEAHSTSGSKRDTWPTPPLDGANSPGLI